MTRRGDCGQALLALVGVLALVVLGALVLGAVARGLGGRQHEQGVADLAALAGARAMHEAYDRLFEPPLVDGQANPRHLERDEYLALGRSAAVRTAAENGTGAIDVSFPDGSTIAPVRIRVSVAKEIVVRGRDRDRRVLAHTQAEAELSPALGGSVMAQGGGYDGPLAVRQGHGMRPDVALAFDRMESAARAAGVALIINSAYRSDAEQAVLFARHPDPKWVATPGQSLHRLGTELDLGPPAAYGWLHANATRFGFTQRYSWEPWHYGFVANAGSTSVGYGRGGEGHGAMPSFVPAAYAPIISQAAQRWNVGAALLAAQLYAESNFNPFARSSAGAMGIAQFMPSTAAQYGLANPYDGAASINAQAHLMRDLLRQFGSVPLALAAYNAGPAPVQRCGCTPPIAETRGYVARILGLLRGAGDVGLGGAGGLEVRLVK